MTRTNLPPNDYAKAAAGWTEEFFAIRITQCEDIDKLRAAAKYEHERDAETRTDRISRINKRLQSLDS